MDSSASSSTRDRILGATIALLAVGGVDGVSTRAVGHGAGVQAPTIYRLFGDKQGLLDAAARRGFADYLDGKRRRVWPSDPVQALRAGWDDQIELALANPALYRLMYDASRGVSASSAAVDAFGILGLRVHAIALAGRLRMAEPAATNLIHAAGRGVALTLIETPEAERDRGLSRSAREAVIAAITTEEDGPAGTRSAAAIALRAALPATDVLTEAESALLADWLERIASADTASSSA